MSSGIVFIKTIEITYLLGLVEIESVDFHKLPSLAHFAPWRFKTNPNHRLPRRGERFFFFIVDDFLRRVTLAPLRSLALSIASS